MNSSLLQENEQIQWLFTTRLYQELRAITISTTTQNNLSVQHGKEGISNQPTFIRAVSVGKISELKSTPMYTAMYSTSVHTKSMGLKHIQQHIQQPAFYYSDWGLPENSIELRANGMKRRNSFSASNRSSNPVLEAYMEKLLPLQVGQTLLLDLWECTMNLWDNVPRTSPWRPLYLRTIANIMRRIEFQTGFLHNENRIQMSSAVHERYNGLLHRSLTSCEKILRAITTISVATSNPESAEYDMKFLGHVFSTVYIRFPLVAPRLLRALVKHAKEHEVQTRLKRLIKEEYDECACIWNQPFINSWELSHTDDALAAYRRYRATYHIHSSELPSPSSSTCSTLSASSSSTCLSPLTNDELPENSSSDFHSAFSHQLVKKLVLSNAMHHHCTSSTEGRRGRNSWHTLLKEVLTSTMIEHDPVDLYTASHSLELDEEFLQRMPMLWMNINPDYPSLYSLPVGMPVSPSTKEESQALGMDRTITLLEELLASVLAPDNLFLAAFISAMFEDLSIGTHLPSPPKSKLLIRWHCIPGYSCLIEAFATVFQNMCQRRPIPVGRTWDFQPQNPCELWLKPEVETMTLATIQVLQNNAMINPFMVMIFEGTNMNDPESVEFSFTLLFNILEKASISIPSSRRCLPDAFDGAYFLKIMTKALATSHVQILLKILTFLYSVLDLLPALTRRALLNDILLRKYFYQFFCHWNDEVRKLFAYLLVYKTSVTCNRMNFPQESDRILLAHTMYCETRVTGINGNEQFNSSSPSLWGNILGLGSSITGSLFSMLTPEMDEFLPLHDQFKLIGPGNNYYSQSTLSSGSIRQSSGNSARKRPLQRLLVWDTTSHFKDIQCLHNSKRRASESNADSHNSFIEGKSLSDEDCSVDISVMSKIDAYFKRMSMQMNPRENSEEKLNFFPSKSEIYVERALSGYVDVLCEYYQAFYENPDSIPRAPMLEFTISTKCEQQ